MDPMMDFAVKPCFIRLKNVGAEKTVTLPKVKQAKEQKQLLPTKKSEKPAANLNNMSNFGLALSPPSTKPFMPQTGMIIPPKQPGLSSRGVNMVAASTLRTERSTKWSAGSGKVEKGQYNSWKDDIENREEDWKTKMKSTYTNNKVPPKKVGLGLNEVKFGQISNNKGQYNSRKDDIENKGKDWDPYNRTETSKANTQDEGLEADVLIRKANSLDLTKLKTELLSSPSIPEEFKKQSENLLIEYRRFLALKVILGDTSPPLSLSPSAIVDSVWHLHLLMPAHYFRCCKQLGEEVIDHDSSAARDHEDIRKKRLEMTKRSYKVAFGEAPPDRFWDLTYQHFTERESTSQNGPSDESLHPENETTYVNIKVLGIDGGEKNIKMRRTSTMAELENYLQKFQKDRMRLLYNDIRPFPRETPNSLNMVDGD